MGEENGIFRLAGCYENALGVEKILTKASRLYMDAAAAGHDACETAAERCRNTLEFQKKSWRVTMVGTCFVLR